MTTFFMHDTYETVNLRCAGMSGVKPRIRAMTLSEARDKYKARQCPLCIPFAAPDRIVVVERRDAV